MGLANQQISPIPYDLKTLMDGHTFTYSTDLVVAASTSLDFLILASDSTDTIINIAEAGVFGAETAFYGFHDSTVSDNGTEVFAQSHNIQKDNLSLTRLFTAPTITDDGNEIVRAVAYAANQPGKIALASARTLNKFILNRSSANILRITNRSATTETKVSLTLDYIEVEL